MLLGKKSIGEPIKLTSDHIFQVEVCNLPSCVASNGGGASWTPDSYFSEIHLAEHMENMPDIVAWTATHCLITTYSTSIQIYSDESCCGKFRSHVEKGIRALVMHRQPTCRKDP